MFNIPDMTPGETNDQWLARVVPLFPAEDVLRAVVAYVYRKRDMDGTWLFLGAATRHDSGVAYALAKRFLPEGTVYDGEECDMCMSDCTVGCRCCSADSNYEVDPECPDCGGSGYVECPFCGGTKKVNGDL